MGLIYLKSDASDTQYPVLNLIDLNLSGVVSIVLSAATYNTAGTYTIINYSRNVTGTIANLNITIENGASVTIDSVSLDTVNKKVTVTLV